MAETRRCRKTGFSNCRWATEHGAFFSLLDICQKTYEIYSSLSLYSRNIADKLRIFRTCEAACGLKWEWEISIPELGVSVSDIPRENVKGRKRGRVLVCNTVAQSIIESQRGKHPEFVFPFRGHRVETMNNTAWQRARRIAGIPDLHIHDLRHTVGMRLREAGIREETIADILWHARQGMTAHY